MHMRKLLDLAGMRYTKIRNVMQNMYFGLYMSFRSVGGFALMCIWYKTEGMMMIVGIACMYLWLQSLVTFPTMVGIVKSELKMKRKLKAMGAKKWWFSENPKIRENIGLLKNNKADEKVF